MKTLFLKKVLITASFVIGMGYGAIAQSYPSASGIMDATGTNANATELGKVTCDPSSQYLAAEIQDQSAPVQGLLLSLHIYKGNQMTTATDPVSGDANASPIIAINGGAGDYYISATKTKAGLRSFTVTFQCLTSNFSLSNTSIVGLQLQ